MVIFPESCLREGGERCVTSKTFGTVMTSAFCRDDYDGTARPRAETNFSCIHGAPICFLASLFMLSLPLISGRPQIVAAVLK